MARKSQYSLSKQGKVGRAKFEPNLEEWRKACSIYAYEKQIVKHFGICNETYYAFLDRERLLEESGGHSEYLEAYKSERQKTRKIISDAFLKNVLNGDVASTIFGMKTHLGFLEERDIRHIELKKIEVAFKTKAFLTDLASKFELNFEQLQEFADKYFKDSKIEDV